MEVVQSPPIYHTSVTQKARSRDAAHRFKYGSPKLVDMMREKCRNRIKEARSEQLLRKRNIVQEEQALLESIVREELSELEHDIELQRLIFEELISQTDEWLFLEYERSETYQIDEYGEDPPVFCPVCQKHQLTNDGGQLGCPCGAKVRFAGKVTEFGQMLGCVLDGHERSGCSSNLQFFMEPLIDNNEGIGQLNAFCPGCDFYRSLTN
ncbi:RIP-like protein [Uranotaenia lowii]|uniref:RIP-like protein n=1 Tax=Uranotaenia lowii TaxID=190385 RepID=UPI0024783EDE|nr:RIP-like protein [Uranotaenia lowii]